MNNRDSNRFEANLLAIICKQNLLLATATITNMGRKGIFVKSEFTDYKIDQAIRIEFCMDDITALQNCSFNAKIIHKDREGFGAQVEPAYQKVPIALRQNRHKIDMALNKYEFQNNKLFLHVD